MSELCVKCGENRTADQLLDYCEDCLAIIESKEEINKGEAEEAEEVEWVKDKDKANRWPQ